VLALTHAHLAAQDSLPTQKRAQHRAKANRWYEQAIKQINSWWRVRRADPVWQAICDFRAEAAGLLGEEKYCAINE
jgi:hypothetical protein